MEYLNEKYPYRYSDAVACYYTYKDCCVMQGVATWHKKLVVVREYHFQEYPKKEIANFMSSTYPWINKNQYLQQVIGDCYCLDFTDESDAEMLADEFMEIRNTDRFVYSAQRTDSKHRDKCLQMLVKGLNYALNHTSHSFLLADSFRCGANEKFANSANVYWHEYRPQNEKVTIIQGRY